MNKLESVVAQLESHIPDQARLVPAVSGASVGWHIKHCLLVLDSVIDRLAKSDPKDFKYTFDLRRSYVLLTGRIPRGRIQAPTMVRPENFQDTASLQQHLSSSRKKLQTLDGLGPGHFFTHPFLGDIKLKPATRFICVHTHHHLSIIRDILRSGQAQRQG